jgi:single-strand DNA-binding protein
MAISINRAHIVGRLGADPEKKGQDGGIVSARVATSSRWRDKDTGEMTERTQWHTVVVFGPAGQFLAQYGKKGDMIAVEGQIETRKWEKEPGSDVYFTEIVVRPYGGSVQLQSKDTQATGETTATRSPRKTDEYDRQKDIEREGQRAVGRGSFSRDLDDEIPFAPEWRG